MHFLRIDSSVASRSVLSVVFANVACFLKLSTFGRPIKLVIFCLENIAKDILSPDSFAVHVTNNHRRKCDIMLLDCPPQDIEIEIK